MRAQAGWTTRVDIAILEWLGETGLAAPPKVIYENAKQDVQISYDQTKRRIRYLDQSELVYRDPERGNYYALTDVGERWYAGDMTKEELESLNPFEDS